MTFAYAPKTPGKKNFLNDPETWELLQKIHALAEPLGLTHFAGDPRSV